MIRVTFPLVINSGTSVSIECERRNAVPDVTYTRDGKIGYITFDRPAKLNALTDEGVLEFANALQEFDADDDAWVGIVSGNGRAFCVGGDLHARILDSASAGVAGFYRASFDHSFAQSVHSKPLVSALQGYVLGKGLSAALHPEIVVAAEDTQFQFTEINLNIAASRYWALVAFRTGTTFAMDVGLSGRYWGADESLRVGLVNKVVPVGEQLAAAEEYAHAIAKEPPAAVRATVRMRRALLNEYEERVQSLTPHYRFDLTTDYHEAVQAKIEKRPPVFTGY